VKQLKLSLIAATLLASFNVSSQTLAQERAERIAADNAISKRFEGTNNIIKQQGINLEANSLKKANTAEARAIARAVAGDAELNTEMKKVGAMGLAAAAANATPTAGKSTAVSGAVGHYQGYSAVSVGITHLVRDNLRVYGSMSATEDGKTGSAVGASFSF